MGIDSAFMFPTACGVPSRLQAVDIHQAALYFDSCGHTLYIYDPSIPAWSVLMGGGRDTVFVADDLYVTFESGHQTIHRLRDNGLISGGLVTWVSGLTFEVSPAVYVLNHIQYTSNDGFITLDSADVSLSRVDAIVLDTTPAIKKVTGMAGVLLTPPVDPSTQILRANIFLNPGDTVPPLISLKHVYEEGVEWDTASNATVAFRNTDNPYAGTHAAYISMYHNGDTIGFTDSGLDTAVVGEIAKIRWYFNGPMDNTIQMQLKLHGVPVTNNIVINPYFNALDSNIWQPGNVPFSAFNFINGNKYNEIVFKHSGSDLSGAKGYYIDQFQLQKGLSAGAKSYVDSTTIAGGHELNWYNGISVDRGSVGGGSGGSGSLQNSYDTSVLRGDSPMIQGTGSTDFSMQVRDVDIQGTTSIILNAPTIYLAGTTTSFEGSSWDWNDGGSNHYFHISPTAVSVFGNYSFPSVDGSARQVITTNGSGAGSWTTIDTTYIPNFAPKVRSLFSATSPVTYVNGLIGITAMDATHAGYVAAGGSSGKVLHGDGTWKDTTVALVGWSLTGNSLLNRTTKYLGSSDTSQVHIKTKGIDAIIIDSLGNVGLSVSPAFKLDVSGSFEIGTGLNTGIKSIIYNEDRSGSATSTNASLKIYPAGTGINVSQGFGISPIGTGASATYKAALGVFNTDFSPGGSTTNYELFAITSAGATGYVLTSTKGGTGTLRPILIDAGVNITSHTDPSLAKQMYFSTTGPIGINTTTPGASFMLDLWSTAAGSIRMYNSTAPSSSSGAFEYLNSPTPTAADQRLGGIVFGEYNSGSSTNAALIQAFSSESHTIGTKIGTYITFATVLTGATAFGERMRIGGANGGVLVGTTTENSTLTVGGSLSVAYIAKTANYTATISDHTIECTANTFTVTLPTAVGITGREYWVTNTGSGTITIATTSSQTFINVTTTPTTLSVAQFTSYKVVSNGANWMAYKIVN